MNKIEDLKQGDKFYDVSLTTVKWYRYLCVHPYGKNYHILIDMLENPIRMYYTELQAILDKNLNTYDDARLHLADNLEEKANRLRKD